MTEIWLEPVEGDVDCDLHEVGVPRPPSNWSGYRWGRVTTDGHRRRQTGSVLLNQAEGWALVGEGFRSQRITAASPEDAVRRFLVGKIVDEERRKELTPIYGWR